jgi:NTP pyrophosphatase (non-canonical NTP hydrolase)
MVGIVAIRSGTSDHAPMKSGIISANEIKPDTCSWNARIYPVWLGLVRLLRRRLPDQRSRFLLSRRIFMDIKDITKLMHSFVRSKGWYEQDSLRPQTPRNLAISLSIEAAEILEHFQWHEKTNHEELAYELADVTLYLLQLASILGIDLEQAVLRKLEVNASRSWDEKD